MTSKMERLFRNKEIKNAGWLIGGRILQMVLSLFVGVLTARYLGPGNYGLISYGGAYVSFFSSLCSLGINSVIIKDFVDNPDEQGEAIGSALLLRFVSSVLSALMIIGIVSIVDKNEPLTIAVVALCSLGSIFRIFETFNFWFQNQYKSKVTALATLCAYIVTSAYKILLLIMGKDVRWFAFATSVDYIVIAIFLFISYLRHGGTKLKFSFRKSKSLLSVSYNYILSSIMVSVYGQTDKLMLKQMMNESEVGYYATATAICAMWTFVLQAIIDSLYPSILRLKNESQMAYEKKNRQLYAVVFYVSFIVSLVFVFFGRFIIGILYGMDYLPAVPVLKTVTWYTAFSYLGVARNAWIVSEGQQKYLKYIYMCAAVTNVFLNVLLIPCMGAVGAALASLATELLSSIILPLFIKNLSPNAKLMIEAICLKNIR
ncbi:flippase [Oribacterium sp. P9]|uniref:flippase n=1 Tax=Oribacterium sp. P9 TaxID=3378068 RepID=UPI0039671467